MAKKYDVFEKDQAVFRGHADAGYVHEVQNGDAWKPYSGDRRAPVVFGNFVRTMEEDA